MSCKLIVEAPGSLWGLHRFLPLAASDDKNGTMNATEYIRALDLQPHPEGGYFRETYRSGEILPGSGLPGRYGGDRAVSTAIYFLLTGDTFSAFHRLSPPALG